MTPDEACIAYEKIERAVREGHGDKRRPHVNYEGGGWVSIRLTGSPGSGKNVRMTAIRECVANGETLTDRHARLRKP